MGNCLNKEPDPEDEIDLRHFKLLRSVGKGAFGKVKVVQKKNTGKLYALKYMSKNLISEKDAVNNVIKERDILQNLSGYPLLVNLCFAFQDDCNLYVVLDLMLGGDLRYYLKHNKRQMDEDLLKFWMAEVALGINYMHTKNAVHRDLKPENLLLDANGHIHISDFNLTNYLPKTGKPLRSLCGTLYYMAPELLAKTGYRESVDWWALGVIMFECMFGSKPFKGKERSQVIKAITKGPLHIPTNHTFSAEAIDLLQQLLQVEPSERIGCKNAGFSEIQAHPFFADIDWLKVEKLEMESPFKPDSTRANFERGPDIEEMFDTDSADKLKYRKRKPIIPSTLSPAFVKMENEFLYFNYERYTPLDSTKPPRYSLYAGDQSDLEIKFMPE